jgi:AraC-like DNA-binding protein
MGLRMRFTFDYRLSDSPYVDAIWHTFLEEDGEFMSLAEPRWGLVVWTYEGKTNVTVRGPETFATPAPVTAGAETFGIIFKLGTFMPHLPVSQLVDCPADMPAASGNRFWLHSGVWEMPTFENADTFIERLARNHMLVREPVVDDALRGRYGDVSLRSVQRRFLRATGLTHNTIYQIERAERAATLLFEGVPILDTVEQAGYADQPHMTRALKRLIGLTPAQIIRTGLPR